jgi:hypothetical protein
MKRYSNSTIYAFGKSRGASQSAMKIRDAINSGQIECEKRVFQEGERLDTIAGQTYGDSSLWWVIAAASGIGWGLQVPPGTRVLVPNIQQVAKVI